MPGMETRGAPRVGASFLAPHASRTALLGFRYGAVVCEAFDVPGHLALRPRSPASLGRRPLQIQDPTKTYEPRLIQRRYQHEGRNRPLDARLGCG